VSWDSTWIVAGTALVIGGAALHSGIGALGGLILGLQFFFGGD